MRGAATARAADTIKLGVTEPLSGTFKDIGERYLEGVQYAAKVLNESGGVLGQKMEVIPIDSELKPDVAPVRPEFHPQGRGEVFLRGHGKLCRCGHVQLAEQNNVIMFSYGMDAASMTGEKCNKNFFRPGGNTDSHSFALAELYAKKVQEGPCIAQDYSFGHESIKPFKRKIKKLNPSIEIVAEVYHPSGKRIRPLREPDRR